MKKFLFVPVILVGFVSTSQGFDRCKQIYSNGDSKVRATTNYFKAGNLRMAAEYTKQLGTYISGTAGNNCDMSRYVPYYYQFVNELHRRTGK